MSCAPKRNWSQAYLLVCHSKPWAFAAKGPSVVWIGPKTDRVQLPNCHMPRYA